MGRRSTAELVDSAMHGTSVLLGGRACYSQLARVIGVFRGQPARWRSGEAKPRRRALKCLVVLARLNDTVDRAQERARSQLEELGCHL